MGHLRDNADPQHFRHGSCPRNSSRCLSRHYLRTHLRPRRCPLCAQLHHSPLQGDLGCQRRRVRSRALEPRAPDTPPEGRIHSFQPRTSCLCRSQCCRDGASRYGRYCFPSIRVPNGAGSPNGDPRGFLAKAPRLAGWHASSQTCLRLRPARFSILANWSIDSWD